MDSDSNTPLSGSSLRKMFYKPITILFENLDNAADDLENVISTFLTCENFVTNIFVPRYDSNLTTNVEDVEQDFAFTLWFQGSLFYLLGCPSLKRIHNLAIKAQIKILTLVLPYPDLHRQLTCEYLESLKNIEEHFAKTSEIAESIVMKRFLKNRVEIEDIILMPNFVTLTAQNCIELAESLVEILYYILTREIDISFSNQFIRNLWDILILILNYSSKSLELQIVIMKTVNFILKRNIALYTTNFDTKYLTTFLNSLKIIISEKISIYAKNVDYTTQLIDTLEICKYYFDTADSTILLQILELCHLIYCLNESDNHLRKSSNKIIQTIIGSISTAQINNFTQMCKHCVKSDCLWLESNLYKTQIHIDVRNALKNRKNFEFNKFRWKTYSEQLVNRIEELNLQDERIFENLEMIHNILITIIESTVQNAVSLNLNILVTPAYFDEKFCTRFSQNFFNMMKVIKLSTNLQKDKFINQSNKILYYLLILSPAQKFSHAQYMFGMMALPFLKQLNIEFENQEINQKLQNLMSGRTFSLEEKINSLKFLLPTAIHCARDQTVCNWIYRFLKQSSVAPDEMRFLILNYIPFLVASNVVVLHKIYMEWFIKKWSDTSNIKFTEALCRALLQLMCITGGNHILTHSYKRLEGPEDDLVVSYGILCLECDRVDIITENNQQNKDSKPFLIENKLYWINSESIEKYKRGENSTSNVEGLFSPFFELISTHHTDLKIIVIGLVFKASVHFPKLVSNVNLIKEWMKFSRDDDFKVREKFNLYFDRVLKNIQTTNLIEHSVKEKLFSECVKGLIETSKLVLKQSDYKFQETVLIAIKKLGCLNIGDFLLISVKLLIHFALNARSTVQEFACIYLQDLAENLKITQDKFYIDFKKDICKTIIELSVVNYLLQKLNFSSPLHKLVRAFGFMGLNDFILNENRHMLPYLIPWIVKFPFLSALLDSVCEITLSSAAELLANNFGNIYVQIYINEDQATYHKCMKFILDTTKSDESTLKLRHFRVIGNEFLLYFHKDQHHILNGLKLLFQEEATTKNEDIVNALQARFHGLLVYFDLKLNSKRVAISDKRHALKSLPKIIKLMGPKNITPLRFKLMATLHSTLNMETMEFKELSCHAWNAFVQNCEIDTLGSLLSSIFISLLPLFDVFPNLINEIFTYLVIDHENDLIEYLPDLFFLADKNVDNRIKAVVLKYTKKYARMSFRDQLLFYLKYLQHENIEMRIYGFQFITNLFKKNREQLNELILGNSGLDPIVVELIEHVMKGFKEKNWQIHLACSTCIGELGAIEPSQLPKKYAKKNETFVFNIRDEKFAVLALNELIRAFQSEKYGQNMDCFGLVIQEILKLYNVTDKSAIWCSFPENHQQIMQPLLTSRYKIAFHIVKPKNHPLFLSANITNFVDWIHSWVGKLILIMKTENFRNLFDCCQPSLKIDMQVLMFFLPYILLHSILEADSVNIKEIYEEMLTVLQAYEKRGNDDKQLQFKPLKSDLLRYMPSLPTSEEITIVQASKIIYLLLDFLSKWLREWEIQNCPAKLPQNDPEYNKISNFIKKIPKLTIAQSNYYCEEFPRALMYLEDYVDENLEELENQLGFFTRLYVQLEDPDSVAGIQAIQQKEPHLEYRILSYEISGQLQDAAACYEQLAQKGPLQSQTLQGLIRCYFDLNNPYTADRIMKGIDYQSLEYSVCLYECEVETLWRLNQYDKLESRLQDLTKMNSWGVSLGRILLHLHKGLQTTFVEELTEIRCKLVQPLSVLNREEGSYEYGYPQIIKLHLLNELEKINDVVHRIKRSPNDIRSAERLIEDMISEFEKRETLVQSSIRILEPMFCLRRIALHQAQELLTGIRPEISNLFSKYIGNYWIKSAKVARAAGLYQQAYINLLNAEEYKPVGLFVERAKLHWNRGEQEMAFSILKRGLEEHASIPASPDNSNLQKTIAEAKLLVAVYNEETANLDVEANITKYKEAIDSNKECEMAMVFLAKYYDKALSTMSGDKDIGLGSDMQLHMIYNFGKSMQFGIEFLYQSMPRMLSIWLDYASRQVGNKNKDTYEVRSLTVLKMTKLISTYLDRLPAYMFLSAFSQIVSRICHPDKQVYNQLKSIIIKLIQSYPQQSLWMIMSVFKSSYLVRVKRCQEIFQDERIRSTEGLTLLIHDFNKLAEKLIELCNKPISKDASSISISSLIKSLPRLISSKEFSQIMIPIEQYLKMVLPIQNESLAEHNPYPRQLVYIAGIEEQVTIMPSLQRPRRITFIGSDGKRYMHMLKPKDDLRKDFRLMEFNGVVNQYLYKEPESRQRRLYIRTYAVIPLNEECGIIEWVPNLLAFRAIILQLHKQKNAVVPAKELRSMICNLRDSLERKRQVYKEQLLARHPLVFHEWFRQTFSDPYTWYHARISYIRTTATISIVGYILGLGDRHGENILLDSTNGDTVHVDFNCLFNRGEALEWPERVPFRLTPNMIKAMGPLGVEGNFRRACEVTMRVLRSQKDTLMSILKPFVYDPLVSWPKSPHVVSIDTNAERTNEQARDHVKNIEARLQGLKGGGKLPIHLSVEGHVNSLIHDATNIDNLCQMYIGWGAYL